MTTDSNAGDGHAELFVADFYPELGEYLAQRHASGYDAVAARARFLSWLAQHVDKSTLRSPQADPGGGRDAFLTPGDAMARNALSDYLAETDEVPAPGAAEIADLGKRIAAGRHARETLDGGALTVGERGSLERVADAGRQARDRLLSAHLRLVAGIAERYAGRGVPFLDLVEEGSRGLIRAAENFDAGKGYPFSVYATWWIRQAVTRALAGKARIARIPVPTAKLISEIAVVQQRLLRELGREPTPEELAAELDTTPD